MNQWTGFFLLDGYPQGVCFYIDYKLRKSYSVAVSFHTRKMLLVVSLKKGKVIEAFLYSILYYYTIIYNSMITCS